MALTILLADDSMTAQKMGKEILTAAGYVVVLVSNGAAAAKKLVDKPDLIILDVFMPGYSGLEICAKVRANADIAKTPILLTVGMMEHFDPQETARVKADGLIIKPFEASDLLAAVKKLEGKLAPPEEPSYEKTMILNRSQIQEFKDESYAEWKSDAEGHVEPSEVPPPPMHMSEEMGSAPAFAEMEMMSSHEPSAEAMNETVNFPPPEMTGSTATTSMDETATNAGPVEFEAFDTPAPMVEAAVEYTSAPARDPGLEITEAGSSFMTQDPALVTDNTTMATEFPTKFGIAETELEVVPEAELEAELVPEAEAAAPAATTDDEFERRVATAMSGYGDVEAETPAEVQAEAFAVEIEPLAEAPAVSDTQKIEAVPEAEAMEPEIPHSQLPPEGMHDAALVEQMQEAFADLPAETTPHVEVVSEMPVAATPEATAYAPIASNTVPDMELATALAAAVGGEMPQAGSATTSSGLDHKTLSQVLSKVMERMMPTIMTEVEKELGEKK